MGGALQGGSGFPKASSYRGGPEWLTLAVYSAMVGSCIPFHEPWADEAQAWQLARSLSLADLFHHYLAYEGHPGLWHLLLWALIRLHVTYTGMHWLTGAIAVLGVSILIFKAPFPRYIRLALPFTFFLAFQYSVVARGYVLVPALLFGVAAAWRRSPVLIALLLGLLGNVSLHTLAISGGLAVVYGVEWYRRQRSTGDNRRAFLATLLVVGLYAFALWTVLPRPADASNHWPFTGESFAVRLLIWMGRSVYSVLLGVVSPWLLGLPLWFLFASTLRRAGRLSYGLPIVTFALFSGYTCTFWHAGLVFLAAIAVCWILWQDAANLRVGSAAKVGVMACIVLQIAWTIHAISFDHKAAYSPDLATARFLAPYVASGEPMAVTYLQRAEANASSSVGLAPYFAGPIFVNEPRPFWLWSQREHTGAGFVEALDRHPPLIVVEFTSPDGRFEAAKDLSGPRAASLARAGYVLTHTFCGEKPEGFVDRQQICHLIFEPRGRSPEATERKAVSAAKTN